MTRACVCVCVRVCVCVCVVCVCVCVRVSACEPLSNPRNRVQLPQGHLHVSWAWCCATGECGCCLLMCLPAQYSGNATGGDNPHMDCKTREVIPDTFLARTHAHLHISTRMRGKQEEPSRACTRTRMRVHARASPQDGEPKLVKANCVDLVLA